MRTQTSILILAGFLSIIIITGSYAAYQNTRATAVIRDKSQIFNLTLIEVAKSIIASFPPNLPPTAARHPNLDFRYSPTLNDVNVPKFADELPVYMVYS